MRFPTRRGVVHARFAQLLAAVAALTLTAAPAAAQPGDSASPSNATNFQSGGQVSVNPRTAAIAFQTTLFDVPGIVNGIGAKLNLSYRQEDAISNTASGTRYFGMPYGWFFDISFIVNNGTYVSLYLDGAESYVLDSSWRTQFTPTGSNDAVAVATGLQQYNRADANLQSDDGTVTVNGIASAYVLAQLGGMVRYFSGHGLLLQESDRFGNTLQYSYSSDSTPQNALLDKIVDSWGNATTFGYCGDGDSDCESGQVTVTLPDGRTAAWVAPDAGRLTKIIDPLGMVTALDWSASPCQDGSQVVSALTLPTGAAMAIAYTCMTVCTASSTASCLDDGNTTTWPVAATLSQCPSISSGALCPTGYDGDDYLTTTYQLGTTDSTSNYTGFPLYSPYASADSSADALMASNDTSFTYTTVVARKTSSGSVHDQTEIDYNFLHLETEDRVYVQAEGSDGLEGLQLAKETSYCYDMSASSGAVDCESTAADYQQLPANYQLAVFSGSCVYNVGSDADSSQARHSVLAYTYDGFGNTLNTKLYHATDASGIVSSCTRSTRLSTSGLTLVRDVYKAYDTPTAAAANGFIALDGSGGHFGLPTGALTFVSLDDDESGAGAHAAVADSSGPVLVTLMCHTLTTASDAVGAGTAIASTTKGLLPTSTATPDTPGVLSACDASSWDTSVAPPKTTSVSYESTGRILTQTLAWQSGSEPGIGSATEAYAYALTATADGEESCPGSAVLQTTKTDAAGYTTTQRTCVLNGFALSSTDASGNTTFMQHAANGMTTQVTHPNGTYVTTDYYYACPTSQDGTTATCPSTSTALTDCPYDDADPVRNCQVHTLHAGTDPGSGTTQSSYADGVLTATIHDGFGRNVLSKDNLGAAPGSGFTTVQSRSSMTYDSLGQLSARTSEVGASMPLVYETTVELDEKLRPKLVCGPRGDAHEFVHDDVAQATKMVFNGNSASTQDLNDSGKLSAITSCALTAEATASGTSCPTVASETSSTDCPGDGYASYTLHDGNGLEHSVTASGGATLDSGSSIASVNGVSVFSADRLQYGYSLTASAADGSALSASSSKTRDLHGKSIQTSLTVEPSDGSGTTTAETDTNVFDARGLLTTSENLLEDADGNPLADGFTYEPTGLLATSTSYAGVTFNTYYDVMNRSVRYCFASEGGGSEGERFVRDPITGEMLTITHFTNPGDCSACSDGDCGDVDGESIQYTYTSFGARESITYSDGTTLQWAYDQYQRLACQADGLATASGQNCPDSPVDADFSPSADQLLLTYTYWDDDDAYRRGLLKSICRGMYDADSGGYVTKCIDRDYYTPVDVGGSSVDSLAAVVGAYAGSMKTESLCSGGSCLAGSDGLVYQTTHLYDEHGRSGSVASLTAAGSVILESLYAYDQYDNVVHETHSSDLDSSGDSNYQMEYGYDGLLRLVSEQRSDASGTLLESTTYEYDAGDNLKRKVQQVMATATPTGGDATATPTITPAPQVTTPTASPTTPTIGEPEPTATPTRRGHDDDGGCQVGPGGRPEWPWLASLLLFCVLLTGRVRDGEAPRSRPESRSHDGRSGSTQRRARAARGSIALVLLLLVLLAGCGDGANSAATSTPTPTHLLGGEATPTPVACSTTDSCSGTHTTLFAIAHSYTDPENTILYRVTVPAASTGTSWGDGNNGFFYQVTLGGSDGDPLIYVPFNGVGAGSDSQPELPQFRFIVPAGVSDATMTVALCASSYKAASGSTPACTTTLWTDTYSPLPTPSVGRPPFATAPSLTLAGTTYATVNVPNNGVYPAVVALEVSGTDLDDDDLTWLYDHLVFFDENGDPYTNDLFADNDESHRSIGVLSIDEAAYQDPVEETYHTKYGSTAAIEQVASPDRQFFFYTNDILGSSAIRVGINFLYDLSDDCSGTLSSLSSRDPSCAPSAAVGTLAGILDITPYVEVTPENGQNGALTAYPQDSVEAGQQENRIIAFEANSSTPCTSVTNPLAINDAGDAYNQPDYLIDDTSGTWGATFPHGLYYVVPSGFGNCDAATTPFCHRTSHYTGYVPHYANTNGAFGSLNGGSTTDSIVGSFALADEYELGSAGLAQSNSLIWFDNCGYGYIYEECLACQNALGMRLQLPDPPDDDETYEYTVTNSLSFPIVFGKECCASYYQENQNTQTYEPPSQLDDSFGAFIPAGESLVYETLFSDEATAVYNAATGEELFRLRLNAVAPAVYSCAASNWSVTVSDAAPYAVEIAASGVGELECGAVGDCPFGMTASIDGNTMTCTATESSFLLGVSDWAAALPAATVQLLAWGGSGHSGSSDSCQLHGGKADGGGGGAGGFALTVLPVSDLDADLFAYMGKEGSDSGYGGSSTILARSALSVFTASVADVEDPSTVGALLVAGGGGGGGDGLCYENQYSASKESGGAGGAGGLAIANADASGDAVSGAGAAGSKGDSDYDSGDGGNAKLLGDGGGHDGKNGLGGRGGGTTDWNTSGPLIPPHSWSAGEGGSSTGTAGGGGGFGGGGHAESGDGSSGAGGGAGGSWAAANTAYDSMAPVAAPDSPNGSNGAVQIVYDLTCDSCGVCPGGTTSVEAEDGEVSCVLAASAAYDVGSWLTTAMAIGRIPEDREIRLTAWGGHGGKLTNGSQTGGAGGMASMSTTAADLLAGSGTLYVYVGKEGCSKNGDSFTGGEAGACGGSSTLVIDGQELGDLQVDGEPGDQGVLLIAGGGGSGGGQSNGGDGGATTSTTDAYGAGAGDEGANCGSQAGGGDSGSGGNGHTNGSDGIGGRGGNSEGWIFDDGTSGIDDPSDWTGGEGATGKAGGNFGGSGGGGWGGGAAGANQSCGGGGGGGGSFAAQATVDGSYGAAASSSPNGSEGGFELYYESD